MSNKPKEGSFLARNPWIYVVLAFALLVGAWSALITVAVKHGPDKIEVSSEQTQP